MPDFIALGLYVRSYSPRTCAIWRPRLAAAAQEYQAALQWHIYNSKLPPGGASSKRRALWG